MIETGIDNAVILCAGRGERLRPLTDKAPKALIEIGLQSALQSAINRIKNSNISHFFFNTFFHAEVIEEFIHKQPDLNYLIVAEKEIRGTGGGIANFRKYLCNDTFFVHNCDVYTEEDLTALAEHHFKNDCVATLMVVDFPGINTLRVEGESVLNFRSPKGDYTYCGVSVISPEIWKYFPSGTHFSLVEVFEKAVLKGERISAWISGNYWNDFGTPQRYWQLHEHLAKSSAGKVAPSAVIASSSLKGFNFIGRDARITNCELENCVVHSECEVNGKSVKNGIFYGDKVLQLGER